MVTEPIRVLHVLGKLNMGGAESRIMDLYRHMDRSKVQFDFLVHAVDPAHRAKEDYDDEVRSLGGQIYVLPRFTGMNLPAYRKAAKAFFTVHHDFAAVEGHMTSMASVYLPIAKAAGVPVTIAHARSAGTDAGIRGCATRLFRRHLADRCDLCLSCSRAASEAVFGHSAVAAGKVHLVPNALDIRSFAFDPEKRKAIRAELGIPESAYVIGHVGRFDPVKNQAFLADVLADMADILPAADILPGTADVFPAAAHVLRAVQAGDPQRDPSRSEEKPGREADATLPDSCLQKKTLPKIVFVGKGALQDEVRGAFQKKGLEEAVIFTGQCGREKTIALYQAFDAFCLPSLYEGLPGTVIEAQAAGLPTLIADTITDEVCVTGLVRRLPLGDASAWAKALVEAEKQAGVKKEGARNEDVEPGESAGAACAGQTRSGQDSEAKGTAARRKASAEAIRCLGEAGYDVVTEAEKLQNFYLHGCRAELL